MRPPPEHERGGPDPTATHFPDLCLRKENLRARMRAALADLPQSWLRAAGEAAAMRLEEIPEFRAARRLAVYLAVPQEMPTEALIERCRQENRALAVPAWDADRRTYRLAAFFPGMPLRRGPWGVPQPAALEWVETAEINLWVVPGLAFSEEGMRLGRGGGWYDRLLAGARAPRLGWALDVQVVPFVPAARHDIRIDRIVTEQRIVNCSCRKDERGLTMEPPTAADGGCRKTGT